MQWGLGGAFLAAVAYGASNVLQALAARRASIRARLDPRLLLQLFRSAPYVVAMFCELAGFLLVVAALRSQPLFMVSAVTASSLAWTAVLAAVFLDLPLRPRDWVALGVVSAGLVLLALSAQSEPPHRQAAAIRWALLAGVGVVIAVGAAAIRTRARSFTLGVLAGLAFSASNIAVRVVPHVRHVDRLFVHPTVYTIVAGGLAGLLLSAQAFQRGSVTATIAASVATTTLIPSAVGLALLHDHPRHGYGVLAAVGFALTFTGALVFARMGGVASGRPVP